MKNAARTMWLFIALIAAIMGGCMTVPNISPSPIMVPQGLNENDVELAIVLAIADIPPPAYLTPGQPISAKTLDEILNQKVDSSRQYYFFEDRADGVVYSGFQYRTYYMRVAVHYDSEKVRLEITDSRNLEQHDNYIHKKAFEWLVILETRIRRALAQVARRNASLKS